MNTSILNMNRTVGERELKQTAAELTPQQSHDFMTEYNLDFWTAQFRKAYPNKVNAMAEAFHKVVEIALTDTAHIRTRLEVALPPAKMTTLQQLADDQAASFNRRYYNNPDGKAEFKY